MRWFKDEASYWADNFETDINFLPDEDNKIWRLLLFEF